MDKFIIRQPNKRSNNSECSNIGLTSHAEVAESSSSSAKKQKSSKVYEKTRSHGWDKNWKIDCLWMEYDEDNNIMYTVLGAKNMLQHMLAQTGLVNFVLNWLKVVLDRLS